MQGKANESKNIETYTADHLTIDRKWKDSIHFDGEPEFQGEKLEYVCHPQKLTVIIGEKFKAD